MTTGKHETISAIPGWISWIMPQVMSEQQLGYWSKRDGCSGMTMTGRLNCIES
jgi:hypothetical protein